MRGVILLVWATILLVGCAGNRWKTVEQTDEFTDVSTKMVTIGDWTAGDSVVTSSLKYYPFIGIQNEELFVGIRSGGRFRVPTGTVQLRIDGNNSWTLSPDETPIYLIPNAPSFPSQSIELAGLDINKFQAEAMKNVAKQMSPYTATTGEKAKSILKEMLNGKIIRYRIIGMNQAASTTGEVELDESFGKALISVGIDPFLIKNRE